MKALFVALAVLCLIAFGLVETGVVRLPDVGWLTKFNQPAPALALPRVELKSLTSELGFLQGSFVISNANAFPIADVAIHCDVQGPDGAAVHTFEFVISDLVPANGSKRINSYRFGFWAEQASQMVCRSTSVARRAEAN